ncbi:DUF2975 domain-containing protein [Novosphingobium sp. TH158]|uniref:DUF2975 domain-containing protein n=1 Tax=Novosphingobium sp. TH158 TaxID=2067455 RepID=UPI000C7BF76E|nr:DUF2975 domain-containing protein [Novosphingobium sp. TH158]PLK27553.1 DUF2975 domain-containing protein [Novosphingobium sp. TH158]
MDQDNIAPPSALPRRDWLLTSARVLVNMIMVLSAIFGSILAIVAVSLPFMQDEVIVRISHHAVSNPGPGIVLAIAVLLAFFAAFLALAYFWLRELRAIIDSVGSGDAFNPGNATRLERMGWMSVVAQVASIPGGALAGYLTHMFRRGGLDVGIGLGGILMALLLFILARVFREGAKMREDLEGTV